MACYGVHFDDEAWLFSYFDLLEIYFSLWNDLEINQKN